MEAKRTWFRRLTQWSLTGVCVVMLWIGGYYGGRKAGFDAGREEGAAVGRGEGYADGRKTGFADGMAVSVISGNRGMGDMQVIDCSDFLDARLGSVPPGAAGTKKIEAEMNQAMGEIFDTIYPDRWDFRCPDRPGFSLRFFPANQCLVVSADRAAITEIRAYLKSKDDYLAWKATKAASPATN